jgi:hypothetical protein
MLTGLGLVAVLIGLLWVGQGLNLIPGSFMTGDPKWFVIGAILTLVGVVLIAAGARRPARRP